MNDENSPWTCVVDVGGAHQVRASGASSSAAILAALTKAKTYGPGPFPYLVSKDASDQGGPL